MKERMDKMETKKKLVFIITTRHFPLGWDNGSVQLDVNNLSLDLVNNEIATRFEDSPYPKTKRFGRCDVFVLPCSKGGKVDDKCRYWKEVFRVCVGDGGNPRCVYLLAHDKDFVNIDSGISGEYVKQSHIAGFDCSFLDSLVDINHAYMYKHGETEVGKIVSKLEGEGKDGFSDKDFDILLNDIIVGKMKMMEFFNSVDDNLDYRYTFPITKEDPS